MLGFHLSRFEVNATPPEGHSLCGGWIKPVEGVDDPLWLRGVVIEGAGLPVVLASLDWTGVMNESHRIWTEMLAEAANTTADRVALHCVHQHNAPFVDREGNQLLIEAGATTLLQDERFRDGLEETIDTAVRESLPGAQPVDGVALGGGGGLGSGVREAGDRARMARSSLLARVRPATRRRGPRPWARLTLCYGR